MKNKETEFKIVTVSTSIIIFILLFLSASSYAQCPSVIERSKSSSFNHNREMYQHFYLGAQIDLNNATDMVETQTEPKGLDFDIEVGYRDYTFAYYGFLGSYGEIGYTNYGAGIDYLFVDTNLVDLWIGANAGMISRESSLTYDNVNYFAYAGRAKGVLAITNAIGLTITGQYQQRPDRGIHGIFEVTAGLQFNLKFQ